MNKISAIVIAKNEEKMIGECLESVSFCDEMLVIDAHSEDDTVAIAKKHGAKVYSHTLTNYAEVRNLGLRHATNVWVLYVDADERVSESLRENIKFQISIRQLADKYQNIVAYRVQRKNFYFGNHEWPYIEKIERLFKKRFLQGWEGVLHESPVVKGDVGDLDGYLFHYTHRNLSDMVKKTLVWSKVEAELRYKAHHPPMALWRFPRVMSSAFFESYIRQSGWKAGVVGLIESMYQSFSIFVTYARLWELQKKFPPKADRPLAEKIKSFDDAQDLRDEKSNIQVKN